MENDVHTLYRSTASYNAFIIIIIDKMHYTYIMYIVFRIHILSIRN